MNTIVREQWKKNVQTHSMRSKLAWNSARLSSDDLLVLRSQQPARELSCHEADNFSVQKLTDLAWPNPAIKMCPYLRAGEKLHGNIIY